MHRPAYNPDQFFHWYSLPVRFRDIDPLNHVNNAVFNTFYEEARIQFILNTPEWAKGFGNGMSFVLVKSTIEYLKPITYPSDLIIGSSILTIGNSSIEAFQAIYSKKEKMLHSVAVTKGVWFDLKRQRPAPLPTIAEINAMMYQPID